MQQMRTLPINLQSNARALWGGPPMLDTQPTGRILIVDDQPDIVAVVRTTLLLAGYDQLWTTTDPRDVIPLARQIKPDLILTDLQMPHLNGFELIDEVRALNLSGSYLPILILTADTSSETKRRALSVGATDLLTKPVDRTELVLRVTNCLRTRALYQELHKQNERLEHYMREQTEELRALHAFTETALRTTSMGELLEGLRQQLQAATPFTDAHFVLQGPPAGQVTETPPELIHWAEHVLRANQPLVRSLDPDQTHSLASHLVSRETIVGLPLQTGLQPFGVLLLRHPEEIAIDSALHQRLLRLTDHLAALVQQRLVSERNQRQLRRLTALRALELGLGTEWALDEILDLILEQVQSALEVDAATVLLFDTAHECLEYAASRGFQTSALHYTRLSLGEGHMGRAAQNHHLVVIPDLRATPGHFRRAPLLEQEGFVAYIGIPLTARGEVVGALELFHRAPLNPDHEWLAFLETLAAQVGITIDNATLFHRLQQANQELALAYDQTLEGWSRALDLRDHETEGHTRRVMETTVQLARATGLSEPDLTHLQRGALLHDIGKMGIPDAILLKPGPLTEAEWRLMRQHPALAKELLEPIDFLRSALDIPYCHHERWDGSGYPQGLKGEEIPLAARIFAVVDVWDALRSNRPYRRGWSDKAVLAYLKEQAGRQFDPEVVERFMALNAAHYSTLPIETSTL